MVCPACSKSASSQRPAESKSDGPSATRCAMAGARLAIATRPRAPLRGCRVVQKVPLAAEQCREVFVGRADFLHGEDSDLTCGEPFAHAFSECGAHSVDIHTGKSEGLGGHDC